MSETGAGQATKVKHSVWWWFHFVLRGKGVQFTSFGENIVNIRNDCLSNVDNNNLRYQPVCASVMIVADV